MENFILTKDDILRAKTYMPLEAKVGLAREIANLCLVSMKTAEQNSAGEDLLPLPHIMEEDVAKKAVLLQNVLLSYYFDIEMEEAEDGYEQYDRYASGHLLNQIERFKGDRETKNAAFDLMEDFREFKKFVDTIIYNEKQNRNDPLQRFTATLEVMSTPENIKILVDELSKTGDELAKKIHTLKSGREGE